MPLSLYFMLPSKESLFAPLKVPNKHNHLKSGPFLALILLHLFFPLGFHQHCMNSWPSNLSAPSYLFLLLPSPSGGWMPFLRREWVLKVLVWPQTDLLAVTVSRHNLTSLSWQFFLMTYFLYSASLFLVPHS